MHSNKKENGQYMTPPKIVNLILDTIDYTGKKILTKKIIEPSFGDGAFLLEIISRIIKESFKEGYSSEKIEDTIKSNVFGIEKDPVFYKKAIEKISFLLFKNNLNKIDFSKNLLLGDAITEYKQFENSMDFVVGNPPYIRIHNIPKSYRNNISDFTFSEGIQDIYVVFYEIGCSLLNKNGVLGYISPNSFLKNVSQKNFRNFLIDNYLISYLFDFKSSKIFQDADTYTCICILNNSKNRKNKNITYRTYNGFSIVCENILTHKRFKELFYNKQWCISNNKDMAFIENNQKIKSKIKDFAVVQNGIVTNKDSVYIIKAFCDKDLEQQLTDLSEIETIYFKDIDGNVREIETGILKRCVKASKYEGKNDNTYIIFPYAAKEKNKLSCDNGKCVFNGFSPLTEEEISKKFPLAYSYLNSFKTVLLSRNIEKNKNWFLFGRSQGLQNLNNKKIVFKHIINKDQTKIVVHILDPDIVVYSGLYVTIMADIATEEKNGKMVFSEEKYNKMLQKIKYVIESEQFLKYCKILGKDMSGEYVSISTKSINNFGVNNITSSK